MRKERIQELYDKFSVKAQKAADNYQQTGITRYDNERYHAEELADALLIALNAAQDHEERSCLRNAMANLRSNAERLDAYDPKAVKSFLETIIMTAKLNNC